MDRVRPDWAIFNDFGDNSSYKNVANIFGSFWGNLENITLLVTIDVTTFWATFGEIGLLFIATSDHTVLW